MPTAYVREMQTQASQDAAAYAAQLQVLLCALRDAARQAEVRTAGAAPSADVVLHALLEAWEEVKAAEAARAAEDAELFKTKTRSTSFATEEVLSSLA